MQDTKAPTTNTILDAVRRFIKLESFAGLLLLFSAILALLVANSPLAQHYASLLNTTVMIQVGALLIDKPLLLWINDGLMAIFFFLIGLELKREFKEGELSSFNQMILPGMGAIGGMLVPALIYVAFNWGDQIALDGWGIPVATDIAFALGLLAAFGQRVPLALKIFLLTLAIFDDLAAIVIIALFYSADLSVAALAVAVIALLIAYGMNLKGVTKLSPYLLLGAVTWVALLKSGVHATLAGVLIALAIPMRDAEQQSPLKRLEHDLHTPVAFVILPIFAFANAGLSFSGLTLEHLIHPVTIGVIAGLTVGKPVGIMLFVGIAVMLKWVKLPPGINWKHILGVAFACGIGFTMSLFIASLAFEHSGGAYISNDRLGILIGSLLSAVFAYLVLQLSLPGHGQGKPE